MDNLSPQLAVISAATTGAGLLMVLSGLQKSLLARRRQARRCPSCGRLLRTRVCETCNHSRMAR
jgi:hypothetical protein